MSTDDGAPKRITTSPFLTEDDSPPSQRSEKVASMGKGKIRASAIYRNMLYKIYKGFSPKYVWRDGKIGGVREYVGHGEEELTWMLFFKDICYVAYLAQCAHALSDCNLNVDVILMIMFAVSNMYNLRVIILDYSCKFFADDYVHRFAYFTFITGIVLMTKNTSTMLGLGVDSTAYERRLAGGGSEGKYQCAVNYIYLQKYVVGLTLAKASMFFLHAVQSYADTSRKFLQQYWLKNVVGIAAYIVLLLGVYRTNSNRSLTLALLMISAEIETVANIIVFYLLKYTRMAFTNLQPYHYPVNYLLTQEAAGIYIMIFIGECIFKLTENTAGNLKDTATLSDLLTLLLLFVFCTQYYDRVQRASHQSHVVQRNFFYGYIWFYCHKWLALCILFMTVGFKDYTSDGKYILSIGCGFATALMVFMRMLHKGVMYRMQKRRRIAYQLVEVMVAVAHFLVVLLPDSVPHYAMVGIHSAIALFLSFFNSSLFVQLSDGWDDEAIEDDVDWNIGSHSHNISQNIESREKSGSVYSTHRDVPLSSGHSKSLRMKSLAALELWDQEIMGMQARQDRAEDGSTPRSQESDRAGSVRPSSSILSHLDFSRDSEAGCSPSRNSSAVDELRFSHLYAKDKKRGIDSTEDFQYFNGHDGDYSPNIISGTNQDWRHKSSRLPKALFLHNLVELDDTFEDFSYASNGNSSFKGGRSPTGTGTGADSGNSSARPLSTEESMSNSIIKRLTLSLNGRPTPKASLKSPSFFQADNCPEEPDGANITL